MTILHSTRLRLEPLTHRHLDAVYAMDSDPDVAKYVDGEPATYSQTAEWVARVERCWAAWGFSWWAWMDLDTQLLVGTGCVQYSRREAEFPLDPNRLRENPLELGWRLQRASWGRGLAAEAASVMAGFAFERLKPEELIAITHPMNAASIRVIERLGMVYRGIEQWYGAPAATYSLSRRSWNRRPRRAL